MVELNKTRPVPQIVTKQGSNMEIAIGADAIEEWLVDTIGPEWWTEMSRGEVPFDEAIKRYWRVRGIS